MTKVYIALQKNVNLNNIISSLKTKQIGQWFYLGQSTKWRVRAENILSEKIPLISISEALNHEAWRLRQPYIDWIGERSHENDTIGWWASEIPAKDPYSFLYIHICFYAVGKSIISKDYEKPRLIICSSPVLAKALITFAQSIDCPVEMVSPGYVKSKRDQIIDRFGTSGIKLIKSLPPLDIGRFFSRQYAQYLEEHPLYRKKILIKSGFFPERARITKNTILFFTYVDNRNFTSDGKYQDPHFGPLPEKLKEKGYRIVYVPRVLPTISFAEAVEKLINTGEDFIFPESYTDPCHLKECQFISEKYSPKFEENLVFLDIPIRDFILENLIETRQAFVSNLLLNRFIATLADNEKNCPYQIMYTCEGHSWESTLIRALRYFFTGTKIVAYDNVTFSRLMLSMFPSRSEYGIRPLPDLMVTNGPLYYDILLAEGYPGDNLRIGCALRHSYLWTDYMAIDNKSARPINQKKFLLVASAISHDDSVELISKTAAAFGGNEGYEIRIKCHPLIDVKKLKLDLGRVISHNNISFCSEPIRDLLIRSDILFYSYTSVCYEALQFGVPPVCVHLENFLTLDKLDSTPGIRWVANTPDEIQNAVNAIFSMTPEERKNWKMQAQTLVKSALAPVYPGCIDAFIA